MKNLFITLVIIFIGIACSAQEVVRKNETTNGSASITKEVKKLLLASLDHFKSTKSKNLYATYYKSIDGINQFDTKLRLDKNNEKYYSTSYQNILQKSSNAQYILDRYKKEIREALPASYKVRSGSATTFSDQIIASGVGIPKYNKGIAVSYFYPAYSDKSKNLSLPKIFFTSEKDKKNVRVSIYIVSPEISRSKSEQQIAEFKTKPPTKSKPKAITKRTSSVKSNSVYEISDVAGTYIGYRTPFASMKRANDKDYKIVLSENYTATFSVKKDDKWLELFNSKLKKVSFKKNKFDHANVYHFKTDNKDFGDLRIFVSKNSLFNPESTSISIKDGNTFFLMRRRGGVPRYRNEDGTFKARTSTKKKTATKRKEEKLMSTPAILNKMGGLFLDEFTKKGSKLILKKTGVFGPSKPWSMPSMSNNKKYEILIISQSKTATPSLCVLNNNKKEALKLIDSRLYADKKRMLRTHAGKLEGMSSSKAYKVCFSSETEAVILLFEKKK